MWKSPIDHPSAFQHGDPHGRDIYTLNNFSSATKGSSLSYNESGSLAPVSSRSMHWCNHGETVTETFAPITNSKGNGEKRQSNGYRLFGIELLEHSNVEETSRMFASRAAPEELSIPSLDTNSDWHSELSNINKLKSDGRVDTMQMFHNINEETWRNHCTS